MRKILLGLLSIISSFSFASNELFQQFDDQYSLGYGATFGNLKTSGGQKALTSTNYMEVEVEKLFNLGIWLDMNMGIITYSTNYNDPHTVTDPLGQNPYLGTMNLKMGYAYNLCNQIQLIPYFLLGKNTNYTWNALQNTSNIANNGQQNFPNITNDFFISTGLGDRTEYKFNSYFLSYFDQNIIYNADNSPNTNGTTMDNWSYTSSLGLKFNLYKSLQLSVSAYYNNLQTIGKLVPTQYIPQQTFGAALSAGLTY